MNGHRRASRRPSVVATIVAVSLFGASMFGALASAAAVEPLLESDVESFSLRAEDWTAARQSHRAEAEELALDLAAQAREDKARQEAAEEAAREAEEERRANAAAAARTTTTVAPTTTAVPTTTAAPQATTTAPTAPLAPAGSPSAAQWQVLRQCESSGNYAAVSANGRYRGAYQFSQATWDWIASINSPSLQGVDPAGASAGDQDAMALALWSRSGWSSWPICGAQAAAV